MTETPSADYDVRLEALTARIYAQSDLLPSKVRNPHGFDLRHDDAAMLAHAILTSDWLAEHGVIPPGKTL